MHSFNKYLLSAYLVQSNAQGDLMEDINIKQAQLLPLQSSGEVRHAHIYYLVVLYKRLRWDSDNYKAILVILPREKMETNLVHSSICQQLRMSLLDFP